VIEFLQTSRISSKHPDFKDLPYKSCLQRISYNTERSTEYTHAFKLNSAYNSEVMPYTNYTFDFRGIIDYIFFSKPNMTPLGLLGPLDPNWLQEHKIVGAPHPVIPSGTHDNSFYFFRYHDNHLFFQITSHYSSNWK